MAAPGMQPRKASAVRKGDVVLMQGFPCRVVDYATSKTGKHGACKMRFVGLDIFTGRKHEMLAMSTDSVALVDVAKTWYCVLALADGRLTLSAADFGEDSLELAASRGGWSAELVGVAEALAAEWATTAKAYVFAQVMRAADRAAVVAFAASDDDKLK